SPRRAATTAHAPVLRTGPATGPRRRRPRPAGKPLRPLARRGAAGTADAPGRFLTLARTHRRAGTARRPTVPRYDDGGHGPPYIRLVSVGAHPVRDAFRHATKSIAHRVRSYPFPVGLAAISSAAS